VERGSAPSGCGLGEATPRIHRQEPPQPRILHPILVADGIFTAINFIIGFLSLKAVAINPYATFSGGFPENILIKLAPFGLKGAELKQIQGDMLNGDI
jgi:hypothetical protein